MRKRVLYGCYLALAGFLVIAVPLFTGQKTAHAATTDCSDVFTPLSSFVVNGVNANKSAYVQAMNEVGVPWEMLAAIHYRETNFSHTNPSNGQGIFQFVSGEGGPYPTGPVSDDEFYRQLKFMATKLQNDYVWRGSLPRERRKLQPNEQNIVIVKDTLYSYNGRASLYAQQAAQYGYNSALQPYEGSPYVVNRFDCPRARMGIFTRDINTIDGIDTRYGTFTIFARLRGDTYWRSLSASPFGDSFILAKSNDPNDLRQWVLYGNVKQYVPSADIIYAWGLQNVSLVTTTPEILNSIPTGSNLTRLMRPSGTLDVYFVDGGNCFKLVSPSAFGAWGLNPADIRDVSVRLGQLTINRGNLSYAIDDPNSANVYMVDGLNTNNQLVLRQFQGPDLLAAWEGDGVVPTPISTNYFDTIDNAIGSLITSTKVTDGSQEYQVVARQKLAASAAIAPLYPGIAASFSSATLERLVASAPVSHFVRSANSSTIYLVDASIKHAVGSPELVRAWGVGPDPLVNTVTQGNLNLLAEGTALNTFEADLGGQLFLMDGRKIIIPTDLDSAYRTTGNVYSVSSALMNILPQGETALGFIKSTSGPAVYLMDATKLRNIRTPADLTLWNNAGPVTSVSDYVLNQFTPDSSIGAYIADGAAEYIIENAVKHAVSGPIKSNWQLANPDLLTASTINRITNGAALSNQMKAGGQYFRVHEGTAFMTVDPNVADVWDVKNSSVMNQLLVSQFLRLDTMTRFARSKLPNDTRLFVVDNGVLYRLSPEQAANLGLTAGQPVMPVNPEGVTPSITLWATLVARDSAGVAYVIDGGAKRSFPSDTVQNFWTGNGSVIVPVATNGFLNLLPTKGIIERAVKGSGPNIYAAENSKKLWIQSWNTFSNSFAPYATVTDQLINAMSAGNNIP